MEEEIKPHPDYIKGFNEGYTISKHLPGLAKQIPGSLGDSLRSTGFKDGQIEHIKEQQIDRYPQWLKGDNAHKRVGNSDRSKEIDDPDLDR